MRGTQRQRLRCSMAAWKGTHFHPTERGSGTTSAWGRAWGTNARQQRAAGAQRARQRGRHSRRRGRTAVLPPRRAPGCCASSPIERQALAELVSQNEWAHCSSGSGRGSSKGSSAATLHLWQLGQRHQRGRLRPDKQHACGVYRCSLQSGISGCEQASATAGPLPLRRPSARRRRRRRTREERGAAALRLLNRLQRRLRIVNAGPRHGGQPGAPAGCSPAGKARA